MGSPRTQPGGAGAWLLDCEPRGLVTQGLIDHGHRAIGLCNIPIGFQRDLAKQLGVEPSQVQLEHVGLNHLSWERRVMVDGVDRLPELVDGFADQLGEDVDLPGDLVRPLRAIPSYYLRYLYLTDEILEKQRSERPRADEVMEIERGLLEMYSDPSLDVKPKLLEQRGGAFYSEAAAMAHCSRGDVRWMLSGICLSTDEMACRISASGAEPLPVDPLAPEMLGLVEQVKAYERLTVAAAISGDRELALKALMANPLSSDYRVAVPLLDALLEGNREHLPRFFG